MVAAGSPLLAGLVRFGASFFFDNWRAFLERTGQTTPARKRFILVEAKLHDISFLDTNMTWILQSSLAANTSEIANKIATECLLIAHWIPVAKCCRVDHNQGMIGVKITERLIYPGTELTLVIYGSISDHSISNVGLISL